MQEKKRKKTEKKTKQKTKKKLKKKKTLTTVNFLRVLVYYLIKYTHKLSKYSY